MSKYQFKLLQGRHSINLGTDQTPKLHRYAPGDIIETDLALDEMFNYPGSTKFERLNHQEPDTEDTLAAMQQELDRRKAALLTKKTEVEKPAASDELAGKSLKELQEIARTNGINLGKAQSHAEVLKVIRQALQPA